MFNENKGWKLFQGSEIVGCVRYLPHNQTDNDNAKLYLCIYLAKQLHSDPDFCASVIELVQGIVHLQHWRKRFTVYYAYNFTYTTVVDRIKEAQTGGQWFGGTVLPDSSGVPLF